MKKLLILLLGVMIAIQIWGFMTAGHIQRTNIVIGQMTETIVEIENTENNLESIEAAMPPHPEASGGETTANIDTTEPQTEPHFCIYKEQISTSPTCTEKGRVVHICECGNVETTEIDELGHREIYEEYVAPTCTEYGWEGGRTCIVCDAVIKPRAPLAPTEHNCITINAKEPTCQAEGYTGDDFCTQCEQIINLGYPIEKLAHTEIIKTGSEPACTLAGYTDEIRCAVCDEILVFSTTISAKGHTLTTLPVEAPTCTKTGLTEGKKCIVCNKTIIVQNEIAKNEHIFVEGICSLCGFEPVVLLPYLPDDIGLALVKPTAEIFGEYLPQAEQLYEALLREDEKCILAFEEKNCIENEADAKEFIKKFSQYVVCNLFDLKYTSYVGYGTWYVCYPRQMVDDYRSLNEYSEIVHSLGITNDTSKYDAALLINNYLINTTTYLTKADSAYDAIYKHQANCAGYAKAFKALCARASIEVEYVVGYIIKADEKSPHAWNAVYLAGTKYYIDVCWNDGRKQNEYLFSTTLWENHTIN